MSKMKKSKIGTSEKGGIYPYPSFCGSHASMIDAEATAKLKDENFVVCKDFYGLYATEKKNLDNKMADTYRNNSPEWRTNFLKSMMG